MAKYCPNCGQAVQDADLFCISCGTRLAAAAPAHVQAPVQAQPQYAAPAQVPTQYAPSVNQAQTFAAQPQVQYAAVPQQIPAQPVYAQYSTAPAPAMAQAPAQAAFAQGADVRLGIPAVPGFSDRVNHPEILKAGKKSRKISTVAAFIFFPLPFIGFMAYSFITGEMDPGEAAIIGLAVSAVFLLFAIISLVKNRAKHAYDATVIDKATHRSYSKEDGWTTEYVTIIRLADGSTKKIREDESDWNRAYDYLQIGDVFRYHPQFAFPYELYDKRRLQFLHCVGCGAKNPIGNDRCERCKLPLLK